MEEETDKRSQPEPGSAASSSGEESTSSDPLSEYFVRHKLTKLDTLAGLAVKYNVTVSDIKRANGLLADSAMFGKDTLLIPTRPLPVGPEYSTWAGMIVTQYGRLGPSDDASAAPSESPYAHLSRTHAMQQLRGYYSTGPSRTHSPQYGSGAEDGDRHHLFAGSGRGRGSSGHWGAPGGQPQVVELMERHSVSASAHYIEERLRRRGRGDSQQDEAPSSSAGAGASSSGGGGGFVMLPRAPLFSGASAAQAQAQAQALARQGGRQLRHWKDTLLHKLKKVASQPALAVPAGAAVGIQQLGQAAVASATPLLSREGRPEGQAPVRQRLSSGDARKAD